MAGWSHYANGGNPDFACVVRTWAAADGELTLDHPSRLLARQCRPPRLVVVAGALVRSTLKLSPSLPIAEGTANGCFVAVRREIVRAPTPSRLTSWPLSTSVAPVNETAPKLSIGRTRFRLLGASSIHSTDERVET